MILRRARVMPAESVFTHGQGPSSSRGVFQKQMTNDATNATMSLQEGQTWGGLDLELGLPPPPPPPPPPPLPTAAPTRVPTVHSLPPSLLLPLPVSLLYTHSLLWGGLDLELGLLLSLRQHGAVRGLGVLLPACIAEPPASGSEGLSKAGAPGCRGLQAGTAGILTVVCQRVCLSGRKGEEGGGPGDLRTAARHLAMNFLSSSRVASTCPRGQDFDHAGKILTAARNGQDQKRPRSESATARDACNRTSTDHGVAL